jgi:hypothetical protein
MRKEDLDRRSAELKARMLAQRNAGILKGHAEEATRESRLTAKQSDGATVPGKNKLETTEVAVLKRRIAQLEAENKSFRQQLASVNYQAPSPSRSNDSVSEQRHNFFKYSNLKRY